MEIDLNRNCLSFAINHGDFKECAKILPSDTPYFVAICMNSTGGQVAICMNDAGPSIQGLTYMPHPKSDLGDDAAKENGLQADLDKMKKVAKKLLTQNKQQKQEYETSMDTIKEQLVALEVRLSASKSIEERLVEENDALLMEQRRLRERVRTLEQEKQCKDEEYKDVQMELDEVRSELSMMKRKQNLNPSRYLQWNSDEAVDWICSIENGRFVKYEDALRPCFAEEGVTGTDLEHITQSALRDWGVKTFKDRIALEKEIQQLVAQYSQAQQMVTHEIAQSAGSNVGKANIKPKEGNKETEGAYIHH